MLTAALILLSCAALLGALLLSFVLRGRHTPKGVALLHGALAALGIVVLALLWVTTGSAPRASLALFVIAALGGGVLIAQDLRHGQAPKPLALGHGLLALLGLGLLVAAWLDR